MTPQDFIAKWQRSQLSERSACQQHFLDLCDLVNHPKPADADPDGTTYTFERGVRKTSGGDGWADVWKRGHFGWEYKARHKDLAAAYKQLLDYREALENPPLLVVCDHDRFEVHTNFVNTVKRVYAFDLDTLDEPENLDTLRKVFFEPQALHPRHEATRITEQTAAIFGQLADALRQRGVPPQKAAHFLMKLVFCFFAEDIELLPKDLFTKLIQGRRKDPERLVRGLKNLFEVMSTGGDFGEHTIKYFDGGLFADADVLALTREDVDRLAEVSGYHWEHIEPSIFGTLYLRTLDPDLRSQIGAQYTSKEDILTLVEPVLMRPLRREWDQVKGECDALWAEVQAAARKGKRAGNGAKRKGKNGSPRDKHDGLLLDFVERLAHVRVLDPACGSGNFLYVAIQLLLDLEKEVIAYAADRGENLFPRVRPSQLYGIEINPYAHELAQIVIWIGYLQWILHNGFKAPSDPVLEPIQTIQRMDSVLFRPVEDLASEPRASARANVPPEPRASARANVPPEPRASARANVPPEPRASARAKAREPAWPEADVIVGNPPFLGGKLLRKNLGDDYVDDLFTVWSDRVPREADLCCYWFEKARAMIEAGKAKRAGLLATQGIRGGANREVLKRIKVSGDIFFAISDRDWVLDGANVHVSMVGFDDGTETERTLDAQSIDEVNPNLTTSTDLTTAKSLMSNATIAFQGTIKDGPFEIDGDTARRMLRAPNPDGRPNGDVVHPWVNGSHVTGRLDDTFIIDFGPDMTMDQAALYEAPFEYVLKHVKPIRLKNRDRKAREQWWIHIRPRPDLRAAISRLKRMACTARVAKHRMFIWLDIKTNPDSATFVFAREDDYFFGVLHSAVHERWSRRMGTQLREAESGCRYTPTTCFETFPFPPLSGGIAAAPSRGLKPAARLRERISDAARKLNELRENWLNPKNADGSIALSETELKKRTLTNLYNERPTWLELAHLELDRAVLAAYGWPEEWAEKLQPRRDDKGKINPILGVVDPTTEQEVLSRLLALNRELSGQA